MSKKEINNFKNCTVTINRKVNQSNPQSIPNSETGLRTSGIGLFLSIVFIAAGLAIKHYQEEMAKTPKKPDPSSKKSKKPLSMNPDAIRSRKRRAMKKIGMAKVPKRLSMTPGAIRERERRAQKKASRLKANPNVVKTPSKKKLPNLLKKAGVGQNSAKNQRK